MNLMNGLTIWKSLFQSFQNREKNPKHLDFEAAFFYLQEDCIYSAESSPTHYKSQITLKMFSSDGLVSLVCAELVVC